MRPGPAEPRRWRAEPGHREPGPDRCDQEQVVLVVQPAQDPRQQAGEPPGSRRSRSRPGRAPLRRATDCAASISEMRIAARPTPTRSCMTAQPSSDSSVARSVVRRRLRVMLTMTTDDDRATHSPTRAAAIGSSPATRKTTAAMAVDRIDLEQAPPAGPHRGRGAAAPGRPRCRPRTGAARPRRRRAARAARGRPRSRA